ncbi:MAG: hypothetical protein ACRDJI_10615, partial [Actinomycetota bacterium]
MATSRSIPRARAVALLVVICAIGLMASAAPAAPQSDLGSTTETPPGLLPFAALARRPESRAGIHHLVSVLVERADSPKKFEYGYSVFVGDISGDGRRDLLVINEELAVTTDGFTTHTTVTAVEGDSGKALWHREVDLTDGGVFPIRGRFGRGGDEGVILVEVEGFRVGTTGIDYVFKALNGRGKKIWSRQHSSVIVGEWPFTFVGTNYLVSLGTFDALRGKATELLMATGAVVYPPNWELTSGIITASVVDGGDGTVTNHPTPETGIGIVPQAGAFQDLDGDGLDDYVFTTIRPTASVGDDEEEDLVTIKPEAGVVDARSGSIGSPLWTASGLRFNEQNIFFTDIGQVVGTPTPDVFVETNAQWGRPRPTGDHTYLIDGDDGSIQWRRLGQWPYKPGDIDKDGYSDVMTQTVYSADGYAASVVWALNDLGRKLWSREYRTENPLTSCCTWMFHGGGSWGVGDVNNDLLEDGFISNWAWGGIDGVEKIEHFVVSPRSGRVLARGDESLFPLGLPVDAGTADIARVSWVAPGNLLVSVFDAAKDSPIISSEIKFGLPVEPKPDVDVAAAYLDRDGCADISLTLRT